MTKGTFGGSLKVSPGYATCATCNRSILKADADVNGLCVDCRPPKAVK